MLGILCRILLDTKLDGGSGDFQLMHRKDQFMRRDIETNLYTQCGLILTTGDGHQWACRFYIFASLIM